MFDITEERLRQIFDHWDLKQELCKVCEPDWAALTTAQRRHYRAIYEFEEDD